MSEHGLLYTIFAPFAAIGAIGAIFGLGACLVCLPGAITWLATGSLEYAQMVIALFWLGVIALGLVWVVGWAILEGD